MTNPERERAFSLRLLGLSWEEIGAELGYTGQAVRKDLKWCLSAQRINETQIPYPRLARYISGRYRGNVGAFLKDVGLPRDRGYDQLHGKTPMTPEVVEQIAFHTGLLKREILERRPDHVSL